MMAKKINRKKQQYAMHDVVRYLRFFSTLLFSSFRDIQFRLIYRSYTHAFWCLSASKSILVVFVMRCDFFLPLFNLRRPRKISFKFHGVHNFRSNYFPKTVLECQIHFTLSLSLYVMSVIYNASTMPEQNEFEKKT